MSQRTLVPWGQDDQRIQFVRGRNAEEEQDRQSRRTVQFDVPDPGKTPQDRFAKVTEIARILEQKGFCIIDGELDRAVRSQAIDEARAMKTNGEFIRPPREVLCGLFGDIGSAWTKELSNPEDTAPDSEKTLRLIDSYLSGFGMEIAQFSQACWGMPINGRVCGRVHWSRSQEDKNNPPLLDPEEADQYYTKFCTKKLKLVYYIGPSIASMNVSPIGHEFEAYRARIRPGTVLVVRGDVCRVAIEPKAEELGVIQELDLMPEFARTSVPPPPALEEWYHERFQAIVDNDVVENVPDEWLKAARVSFFKGTPIRIVETCTTLPTVTDLDKTVPMPFEASVFGGCDCITEVPSWKWDVNLYYDEDKENVDDFKMYTRHMGALDLTVLMEDFETGDAGKSINELMQKKDQASMKQHIMLAQSCFACLKNAGFAPREIVDKDVGIYAGLAPPDMFGAFMEKSVGALRSLGTSVNMVSWALSTTGPGIQVDTEDSSSAVAVDTAVTHIRSGKCGEQALASGVCHVPHPVTLIVLCASWILSPTGRSRVFDESSDGQARSEGVATLLLEKHPDGAPLSSEAHKGVILGSAVCSKGRSASLTAPSKPAARSVYEGAMKDSGCPAAIFDCIDVHAAGQLLADVIEVRVFVESMASSEAKPKPFFFRNAASAVGSAGPASGIVSIVRALAQMQTASHGPCLHLHTLNNTLGGEIDNYVSEGGGVQRCLWPTEVVKSADQCQTTGVSSFGMVGGTLVHHVISGIKQKPEGLKPGENSLNWFPSSVHGDATAPKRGYYITGTWNAWSDPVKMEVEEPGVYAFTIPMGDNMWESFLIWLDGDKEKVLYPNNHWSHKDSKVLGPEYVGRQNVWCIDARPGKARLVTEKQKEALDEKVAADIAAGKVPAEPEYPVQAAFKADNRPAGFETASVDEMPVYEQFAEDAGVPGDLYRVRLHTLGSFKRVTWEKLVTNSLTEYAGMSEYAHNYFVVGDNNYWTFQEMQVSHFLTADTASGELHTAEVHCLKEASTFQIVRDSDWDQGFYPKYPELTSTKSPTSNEEIAGPDGTGLFKKWVLPNKVGDIYQLEFRRARTKHGKDERSLSWKFLRNEKVDFEALAKTQEYHIVTSAYDFTHLITMTHDSASSTWTGRVRLPPSGKEEFIILMNKNWLSSVHPSFPKAHYLDSKHQLHGPDDGGDKMFWSIGRHEEDKRKLKPGDFVQVTLKLLEGLPSSVSWCKSPDQTAPKKAQRGRAVVEPGDGMQDFAAG